MGYGRVSSGTVWACSTQSSSTNPETTNSWKRPSTFTENIPSLARGSGGMPCGTPHGWRGRGLSNCCGGTGGTGGTNGGRLTHLQRLFGKVASPTGHGRPSSLYTVCSLAYLNSSNSRTRCSVQHKTADTFSAAMHLPLNLSHTLSKCPHTTLNPTLFTPHLTHPHHY
jgi:hypothetical protein